MTFMMMVDLKVTVDLAGFTALPLYFHRRPDAQCQHGDERIAKVVFHLYYGYAIGVKAVADRSGDLFGVLDQPPEKGVSGPGVHFCAWLDMGGDAIGVAAAE